MRHPPKSNLKAKNTKWQEDEEEKVRRGRTRKTMRMIRMRMMMMMIKFAVRQLIIVTDLQFISHLVPECLSFFVSQYLGYSGEALTLQNLPNRKRVNVNR